MPYLGDPVYSRSKLPGGSVSRFGAIIDVMREAIGKDAEKIARTTAQNLIYDSPKDTNNLARSWRFGTTPNDYVFPYEKGASHPLPFLKKKPVKKISTWYIWNNVPYLGFVNDGFSVDGTSDKNINFIQKSIKTTNANFGF